MSETLKKVHTNLKLAADRAAALDIAAVVENKDKLRSSRKRFSCARN